MSLSTKFEFVFFEEEQEPEFLFGECNGKTSTAIENPPTTFNHLSLQRFKKRSGNMQLVVD